MHKGAEAAAKAVGAELIYQGAAEWNVSLQVPILDAIIAQQARRDPDRAERQEPARSQPLKKASDAGIAVVCVDTFIGNGVFQTGSGDADFPISYVASDNVLGGRMAARALAKAIGDKGKVYVSNVDARRLDHRPARGRLQGRDEELQEHRGAGDPVQRRRRQQGGGAVAGGARPRARSRRRVRRQPVLGLAAPPTASRRRARPARSSSPASTRRSRSSPS